jgi:hypothetical protein
MITAGKVMVMTIADLEARNTALSSEVRRSHEALKIAQLTIDKMKVELTYLRRMKYGRSSEKIEHAQLELVGGQLSGASSTVVGVTPSTSQSSKSTWSDSVSSRSSQCTAAQRCVPNHCRPRESM